MQSATSLKIPNKSSFQMYTIRMLKDMKEEALESKQYRLRSSIHWIDEVQILPDQTQNDLYTKLIFEQYQDTAVKSWMNFLLYHDAEKITIKLSKDVMMLQDKAKSNLKSSVPDIYFQFYDRLIFLLYKEIPKNHGARFSLKPHTDTECPECVQNMPEESEHLLLGVEQHPASVDTRTSHQEDR